MLLHGRGFLSESLNVAHSTCTYIRAIYIYMYTHSPRQVVPRCCAASVRPRAMLLLPLQEQNTPSHKYACEKVRMRMCVCVCVRTLGTACPLRNARAWSCEEKEPHHSWIICVMLSACIEGYTTCAHYICSEMMCCWNRSAGWSSLLLVYYGRFVLCTGSQFARKKNARARASRAREDARRSPR